MIALIFRKHLPTAFSIEKIFRVLQDSLAQSGLAVEAVELPHVSASLWRILRNALFLRRKRRAALFHVTGDVHYAALLCPGTPTIITVHDCVALQRGRGLKRLLIWLLWFKLPFLRASRIVAISEQTLAELRTVMSIPEQKLQVIPNFVDPAFQPVPRIFCSSQPRVLHVGTNTNKNLPRVIEALAGLGTVLVIVGGVDAGVHALLAQHGVEHELHANVAEPMLRELYGGADIVSFPSTYEGFGMPILEAQVVGRPVLTSDREPMRSVAGSGALLVDPESVASIRAGFRRLIEDAALRHSLVAAGTGNVERYALAAVVAQYVELYRTVAHV